MTPKCMKYILEQIFYKNMHFNNIFMTSFKISCNNESVQYQLQITKNKAENF